MLPRSALQGTGRGQNKQTKNTLWKNPLQSQASRISINRNSRKMSQPQFTTKQIQQGNSVSYLGTNRKQETTSRRPMLTHQCPGLSATRQAGPLDSPDPPPPHPCTLQWVFQSRGGLTGRNALAHTLWNVSSPLAGRVPAAATSFPRAGSRQEVCGMPLPGS